MENEITTGIHLDIIRWTQGTSTPALDVLAGILNILGSNPFYLVVIVVIFLTMKREIGWRLLFAWVLVYVLNNALKLAFHQPRPFHIDANVSIPENPRSYGFPSGHVMTSVVMLGMIALQFKRPFLRWAAVLVPLLIAWARMYSGVHYLQDVVGGAIFGVMLLWALPRLYQAGGMLIKRPQVD